MWRHFISADSGVKTAEAVKVKQSSFLSSLLLLLSLTRSASISYIYCIPFKVEVKPAEAAAESEEESEESEESEEESDSEEEEEEEESESEEETDEEDSKTESVRDRIEVWIHDMLPAYCKEPCKGCSGLKKVLSYGPTDFPAEQVTYHAKVPDFHKLREVVGGCLNHKKVK